MHLIGIALTVLLSAGPSHPVTWHDLHQFPGSSVFTKVKYQPADVMVEHNLGGSWSFRWPYYTAIMGQDTLSCGLLGSDTELVLTTMGYNDQSPYELCVQVVTIETDAHGHRLGRPRRSAPMTKAVFDHRSTGWEGRERPPFNIPKLRRYR